MPSDQTVPAPRIVPAQAPYSETAATWFERLMPEGVEPLILFRTLAVNDRVLGRVMSGGLLDRGSLQRRARSNGLHAAREAAAAPLRRVARDGEGWRRTLAGTRGRVQPRATDRARRACGPVPRDLVCDECVRDPSRAVRGAVPRDVNARSPEGRGSSARLRQAGQSGLAEPPTATSPPREAAPGLLRAPLSRTDRSPRQERIRR